MPTYRAAIPQRVVPGSHLDFSQELKEGWCQWYGEKTSCEGWWRQWKLSSLEFNQVLFVWKPEKNLSVCVVLLGLSCRIPLGLKTHHRWDGYMLNSGGFVLCNPSRFCFRYTQERETQGWPPRKMGLDKNCLFLKKSETKKKSYYTPRKIGSTPTKHNCPFHSLTCSNIIFGHFWSYIFINTEPLLCMVLRGNRLFLCLCHYTALLAS